MTFWWNPCVRVERRLSLSAAGVLPEADRQRMDRHLARCPRCQARLRELQMLAAGLETMGQALPPVEVPGSLRQRWEQEVLEAARRQPDRRPDHREASIGWLPAWLDRTKIAWGTVVACWALAALFRFAAPEAPRPAVAATPLSLREILVVLRRERPRSIPIVIPSRPASSEPKASRPSARSETPMGLEAA